LRIRVGQIELLCRVAGDGSPLLFIHGFPLTGEMWSLSAAALEDRWRCIVPDLRGHGRSDATPQVSIRDFADDLAGLLAALGETRPVVAIGLSMGGIIALDLYRRHRTLVAALVLCNTRAGVDAPEAAARREQLAQSVLRDGSGAAADALIASVFAPDAPPELRRTWHTVMSSNPPTGVAAAARALAARPDATTLLPTIDCPTLVVAGEHDSLTPVATLRAIADAIPSARLEVIPGAGHVPPVEQPSAFVEALRRFLTRQAG
jgi:3-oxoadipate enol-lactonase